jgi:type II secretory ATPase GspE/PulE/Tfp pilus assembly ATPase PilB-like protein
VEYRVPGINQVHVNPKAGLTFPVALRAVLRQDPDIIMIGEIRDRETAEIAMTAAVTGHLVFSTIHTVDAPGAVTRLLDMGVQPFLVAGGLSGVVSQRLVRTICRRCQGRDPECRHCAGGYSGRTGVFQVLALNDAMRDEITREASTATLRQLARKNGMGTLREDAQRKIAEGLTTPHEVARVVPGDLGSAIPCRHCSADVPNSATACPFCGRQRRQLCSCGQALQRGWRFCPKCVRSVSITARD